MSIQGIPEILRQLGGSRAVPGNPAVSQVRNMMNLVRASGNPQEMLRMMAAGNPRMQEVLRIVQEHGGDPMQAFRAAARERGVDPEEILNMLR